MATILQFAERLADGQDWTVSERAQLRDVGAQLDGVDVVFGKSEAGDPWCVVTDEVGEVLLHVARIDGDFVVHATHEDEVVQDEDLWSAAKRLLGDMLKERRGVLLAFPPEALGQTAVLAFLFAAAMRGEFDHWLPTSVGDPPPPAQPHGATVDIPDAQAARAAVAAEAAGAPSPDPPERGEVVKEAIRADTPDARPPAASHDAPARGADHAQAPAANEAPAPAAPQNSPTTPVHAGPTTARTEPAGSPTGMASFSGAGSANPGGGGDGSKTTGEPSTPQAPLTEFVEGGEGDDRIAMAGNVAAAGGGGADTFVLTLPNASRSAPVLLGVVADFRAAEGDRLEVTGKAVMVVDRTEHDFLSAVRSHFGSASNSTSASGSGDAATMTGRHIGYDVDGDGQEDAYVLVTGGGGGWFTSVRQARGVADVGAVSPGAAASFPGAEGVHAPISLTAEAPHPPPGADFLF